MALYEVSWGNNGWARVSHPELPGWLYVRFEPDGRGRLRPVDLFLEGTAGPIAAAHLRALPLADIEAAANGSDGVLSVQDKLTFVGPDLRTLAASFRETRGITSHELARATSAAEARGRKDWVALAQLSQYPDDLLRERGVLGEGEPTMPRPHKPEPRPPMEPPEYDLTVPRACIRRPAGRTLPDGFLVEVAHAYTSLARDGQKPAPVIASEAEVPVTTVHRWIKEARRRGLLAPARRGATG